jgi:hypothetical protein
MNKSCIKGINKISFLYKPTRIIFNMLLTLQEKKDLAIKLIEQGVPQKEIAKQSHLSFSPIAKIRRNLEDDTSEKNSKIKSIQAQAFMLFEKNKTLFKLQ